MLNIQCFVCNPFQENTYVVSDSTGEAIIIDCGACFPNEHNAIKEYIIANQLKPVMLLGTHGHLDHHIGDSFVYNTWGLKPQVHIGDKELMQMLPEQANTLLNMSLSDDEIAPIGKYLSGDDVIKFGHHEFTIIETPGHSPGSVIFYCKEEDLCFSGDMLFKVDEIISYISQYFTLRTGDLLYTGCPTGCAPVRINDHLEGYIEEQKVLEFNCK